MKPTKMLFPLILVLVFIFTAPQAVSLALGKFQTSGIGCAGLKPTETEAVFFYNGSCELVKLTGPVATNEVAATTGEISIVDYIKTKGWNWRDAVKIFSCETHLNPLAVNKTAIEESYGVAQINVLAHPRTDKTRLLDFKYNLDQAYGIYQNQGNWSAWYNCAAKTGLLK